MHFTSLASPHSNAFRPFSYWWLLRGLFLHLNRSLPVGHEEQPKRASDRVDRSVPELRQRFPVRHGLLDIRNPCFGRSPPATAVVSTRK